MRIVVAYPIVLQLEYHRELESMGDLKVYNTCLCQTMSS